MSENTCGICFEEYSENRIGISLNCSHIVCNECYDKLITAGQVKCPFCRNTSKFPNASSGDPRGDPRGDPAVNPSETNYLLNADAESSSEAELSDNNLKIMLLPLLLAGVLVGFFVARIIWKLGV